MLLYLQGAEPPSPPSRSPSTSLSGLIFSRARHRLGIFALENPLLSLLKPPQNPDLLLLLLSHFFQAMDPTHLQQKLLPMIRFNLQSFTEVLMGSLHRIWKRTDR